MREYMPEPSRDRKKIEELYQKDNHPTDRGMVLYGEVVAKMLLERL